MQDAEKRLVEEMRVEARGDPAVARTEAGAERVRGRVQPAGVEIEADRGRRRLREHLLPVHWEFAV